MNTLKLILFAVLCTSVITACSSKNNNDNSAVTHTPEATNTVNTTEDPGETDNDNTVRDAAGNIIDDAGNIVEDTGDAVDDAADDIGNAVKD